MRWKQTDGGKEASKGEISKKTSELRCFHVRSEERHRKCVLKRLKLPAQHTLSDQLEKEEQILVYILERSEHGNISHKPKNQQVVPSCCRKNCDHKITFSTFNFTYTIILLRT